MLAACRVSPDTKISGMTGRKIISMFCYRTYEMPKFINKNIRGQWDEEHMRTAVRKVLDNELAIRDAAKRYGVPKSTLADKVKHLKNNEETQLIPSLGRYRCTFPANYEQELVNHMRDLDSRLMPLTKKEFLKLAFDVAERLKIPHRFNREKKTAGKDFYYTFLQRHPELSLRNAESTSLQRAVGFNRPQVARFFNKLEDLMQKYNFRANKIFNADETGVSTVHECRHKVVSIKGKKQVGKMTSGERGRTITVLLCINAAGDQFIPPLFIFPRKKIIDRLKIGAPENAMFHAQDSGWMNGDIFFKWIQEFVKFTRPSEEEPVLLIVDGHCSHKDLQVINFARKNHIHMLSLPPHCTHKLQPLDVCVMKPFKDAYNEAASRWMRQNPFMRISDYEIAGLVNDAFTKICRMDLSKKGFECSGIYPLNSQIFTDLDFIASQGLDVPEPREIHASTSTIVKRCNETESETIDSLEFPKIPTLPNTPPKLNEQELPGTSENKTPSKKVVKLCTLNETCQPSTSKTSPQRSEQRNPTIGSRKSSQKNTLDPNTIFEKSISDLLKEISPIPNAAERRMVSRKRRAEKSEVLTSTPFKNELEEKNKNKAKGVKKNLSENVILVEKKIAQEQKKKKAHKEKTKETQEQENGETYCVICQECFDEDWIQCCECKNWVHEACSDVEKGQKYYKCDNC